MRVSDKWLRELVDIDVDINKYAIDMLNVGNEYDSINEVCPANNLVIGKVLTKRPHPDSDHLNICEVDLGDGVYQIVCGAPNVDVNQKVIVARVGAVLPGGVIKQSTIRGIESSGMICSLVELGLESKYVSEEDKKGIHILSDDAIVGMDAKEYLGLDDKYVDYELTANRSDLLNMLGMSYEIGAIYNKKVNMPKYVLNEINESVKDYIKIENKTDNCYAYMSRIVKNVVIKESPMFIKSRLMSMGIRPINNVVDISNYVMLLYGQPLHFFDLDKVGNKIIIRQASNNEEITTLDNIKRTLKETDIVIANETEPLALAGVMGGLSSEVEDYTKNILIESAIFNPYNIRYTSKEILRSEASIRFEKGIDPNRTIEALNYAAYLLNKYASGEVLSDVVGFNNKDLSYKEIEITVDKINKVLGMNISKEEIGSIFDRLSFTDEIDNNLFKVKVPTRRLDISIKEDLIEEIGRIHGYAFMNDTLPVLPIKRGKRLPKNKYIKDIKNRLYSLGLNEVITYSLINKEEIELFKDKEFDYIKVSSPLTEDKSIMRYSLIPSLLKVADYNIARNIKDVNIFEVSKVYYNEKELKEENKLSILMTGTYIENTWGTKIQSDFYTIKGVLENIINYLGLTKRYKLVVEDMPKEYHKGVSAKITIDNTCIGYIGKVHPNITKKDIYVLELNLDTLYNIKIKDIKFKEVPKYPSVIKDVAFILDNNTLAGEVITTIERCSKIISDVVVFDVFNNIEPNKKSVAFKITFQDPTKTLTDIEVTEVFNKVIDKVEKEFNAVLRNK